MHVYNELMFVCVLLLKLFGKIHGPKMKNIFLGEPLPNFFHPQFTKLIAKILTRLGVDKVKPKGWFKYF